MKRIGIIILNWNNASDTIECLESVLKSDYKNISVFLVDNHSDDDSVQEITSWLEGRRSTPIETEFPEWVLPAVPKPIDYIAIKVDSADSQARAVFYKSLDRLDSSTKIFFIQNSENAGFAKGNNLMIQYFLSSSRRYDYIYLLNNDTVITPDTISALVNTMEEEAIDIANSVIYYYYEKDKIAFAGGKILPWAKAKYFNLLPKTAYRKSTFAHGCALMLKKEVFGRYGILTEKFFHGEEDFEFSWRLKQTSLHIACVTDSRVYHKEGVTIGNHMDRKKRLLLSILNRVIDMKTYFNPLVWNVWKNFVMMHYFYLFTLKYNNSVTDSFRILKRANSMMKTLDGVSQTTFNQIYKNV